MQIEAAWKSKIRDEIKEIRESIDWSDSIGGSAGAYYPTNGAARRFDALCLVILSLIDHIHPEGESKEPE